MQNKKSDNNNSNDAKRDDEKILYSSNSMACFACGERINKETVVCPYCKTHIS